MNDSTSNVEEPTKGLIKSISKTLKQYFNVRRQRAELKLALEKKQAKTTAKYHLMDEPLATLESELALKLRALIIPNKVILLSGDLRSFATHFGNVSFRKDRDTSQIIDVAGLEDRARRDGLLTTLGAFTRTWKPMKVKDFQEWLSHKDNAKYAKKYRQFLSAAEGSDRLYVQPTSPYLERYDPNRLTEPKVSLGEANYSPDEQSPDA